MNKILHFFKTSWWTGAGTLVVFVFIAYFPTLHNGFIWDDDRYLTDNPHLNDVEGLKQLLFAPRSRPQYYPLVFTSFWVEHKLWALDPFGYHVDNVLLQCVNSVLLWRVLALLSVPGSWLVAAIFAVHPVQVETVAWVTERKNLLSGFFYFLSLYIFLRFHDSRLRNDAHDDPHEKKSWSLYGISFVFFICALLSKTVTCTLPAVLLLICWWKQGRIGKESVLFTLPFLAAGLGFAYQTAWMEQFIAGARGPEWEFSFFDRFLVAGRALWFYIGKLAWPFPVIFTYPRWNIDDTLWWQYLYPFSFLLLILVLWCLKNKIGRGPLAGVLFFAGSLFPALGFFNVYPMRFSFVADHFQYLSCIGIIALFSVGVVRAAGKKISQAAVVLLALFLIFLANLTWSQGPVYKDSFSLWTDTIRKNPNAWMARYNLGNLLAARGKTEEAVTHFRAAVSLKPDHVDAYYNLGNALLSGGNYEEAIAQYGITVRLKPDYEDAHNNLGAAMLNAGRVEEAITQFREAIKIRPDFASAHNNLAIALRMKN